MDLALNNLQICHKTQQTKPNQQMISSRKKYLKLFNFVPKKWGQARLKMFPTKCVYKSSVFYVYV